MPGYIAGAAAWFAWTALIAASYFTVPQDRLSVGLPEAAALPYWRAALGSAAAAFAGAAVVCLAAWAAGAILLSLAGPAGNPRERALIRLAFGFATLAMGSLALAVAGVYSPGVVRVLVSVAAAAGVFALARDARWRTPVWPGARGDRVLLVLVVVACAGGAVGALAPEIEYDALWYHLWLPEQWMRAGRPVDIVHEYVSLYPLSWELAYGAAMTVGGVGAAKLLHWGCLPLLGVTTAMLARELCPRANPILAAALAIVTPTILWEATTAYVDLAVAWYLALATYAVARYARAAEWRWLTAAALLTGGALAIKHLALVAFPILAAAAAAGAYARTRTGRATVTAAAAFVALALLLPAPWYARAYMASGNPVFPDLYGVFGAAPESRWSHRTERGLRAFKDRFGRQRTPGYLATLPWDVTVHGARYGGTAGPLFLVLVPAAWRRWRSPAVAALTFGVAAYAVVWASPVSSFQLRFLVPVIPPLAVLAACGAAEARALAARAWRGGATVVSAAIAALLLANLPPFITWHERDRLGDRGWLTHVPRGFPFAVVLGAESAEAYVDRHVRSAAAWRFVNASLPPEARVLTFSGGDHLYSRRARLWSDSTLAFDVTWGRAAGAEGAVLARARELGITHVLFDRRQLEHGGVGALAIGSARMRACCLQPLYEDGAFVLYRLRPDEARHLQDTRDARPADGPSSSVE